MVRFFIVILAFTLLSCNRQRCVDPTGQRIIGTRSIEPNREITLNMVASLEIEIDADMNPQIEKIAQAELQREIAVDERSETLTLFLESCLKEHLAIDLNLRLPSIKKVNMLSAGSIKTRKLFDTDSLELYSNGLGDIDFSINGDYVRGEIRNSGNIILNGYSRKSMFDVFGSGDVHAYDLQTDEVVVNTTGISVIEVYAGRKLRVNFIKPGGKVKYRGNPEAILITGVGELIDDNL
jgi:hypothetical protein